MPDTYVTHTADDFAQAFANELPVGAAWPRDPASGNMQFIAGLSDIWATVAQTMTLLLFGESDPSKTSMMLDDWLANYQLPDPCLTIVQTPEQLQAALMFRILLEGGASRQFFISLAASLGYTITIEEYTLFKCGLAECGVSVLNDPSMQYQWTVNVATPAAYYFHTGLAQTGITPLLDYMQASDLECILRRFKPAHTILNFYYVPEQVN